MAIAMIKNNKTQQQLNHRKLLLTYSSVIRAYPTSIYLRGFLEFPPTTHLLEEKK
jgi:hypothetical protein